MKTTIYIIGLLILFYGVGFSQFSVPATLTYSVDTLSATNIIFNNGTTGTLAIAGATRDSTFTGVGGHFTRGLLVDRQLVSLSLTPSGTSGQFGWLKRNASAPQSGYLTAATATDTVDVKVFYVNGNILSTSTRALTALSLTPTTTSGRFGWLTRNASAPESGTLTASTATDTLSLPYLIVTTKLTPPTSGQVGFLTRNASAPQSGTLTTSTNTDTLTVAKLSVGSSSVFSSMGSASQMDSARVATLDKAQTLTGIQTFSGFNTFTGSNVAIVASSTNDSVQVSLAGITSSSIIIACYSTNVVTTTSLIPVGVGNVQTGKFTIYATNGQNVAYFIVKK